jgi:predicted NAD-dependent protein-ADP-ribosyltransferase YbiA (DUF1768 family)
MVIPALPSPLTEPMIYLSVAQRLVAARYPALAELPLPCWAPHRLVAQALGHDSCGIDLAQQMSGGRAYAWATEFENVHSLWRYQEPAIVVRGVAGTCSEMYFHGQKPTPYDDVVWRAQREAVMEDAVRAKIAADPLLAVLLVATAPHPLVSIKNDAVWGFTPRSGGQNLLAKIWMRVRDELVA